MVAHLFCIERWNFINQSFKKKVRRLVKAINVIQKKVMNNGWRYSPVTIYKCFIYHHTASGILGILAGLFHLCVRPQRLYNALRTNTFSFVIAVFWAAFIVCWNNVVWFCNYTDWTIWSNSLPMGPWFFQQEIDQRVQTSLAGNFTRSLGTNLKNLLFMTILEITQLKVDYSEQVLWIVEMVLQ
jgi:hypothetical protein